MANARDCCPWKRKKEVRNRASRQRNQTQSRRRDPGRSHRHQPTPAAEQEARNTRENFAKQRSCYIFEMCFSQETTRCAVVFG
jgi:hypothetical protein